MNAVDLFSGAGGFSLGLRRAGFNILLANEMSTEPEWTYRHNLLRDLSQAAFPELPSDASALSRKRYRAQVRMRLEEERDLFDDDYDRVMRGGDISKALRTDWLREWRRRNPSIDILVAGPPCQGFSTAGRRADDDQRNLLALEAVRVAKILQPKVVIVENVPGMLLRHPDRLVAVGKALSDSSGEQGYRLVADLLNCERFGVPQTRRRLLLVGVRRDVVPEVLHRDLSQLVFPTGCPISRTSQDDGGQFTHVAPGSMLPAGRILGDLRRSPPKYGAKNSVWSLQYEEAVPLNPFTQEIRATREVYLAGGHAESTRAAGLREYTNHEASRHSANVAKRMRLLRDAASRTPESKKHRCSSGWLKRQFIEAYPELRTNKAAQRVLLADEWPSLTVTSLPDDIVHYREDRIPTVREMARLQTFPDWFEFKGVRTTGAERRRAGIYVPHYTQVANAVPPRLAFGVASHIRSFLLDAAAGRPKPRPYISAAKGRAREVLFKLNNLLLELP